MLKAKITKADFDKLAADIKEHYKASGDDYVLDTDADASKSKLAEFRQTNIDLMKKQEILIADMKKFEGIDPEKVKAAELRLQEMEDQHLLDENKLDELLEVRTERMQADFNNRYEALETAHTTLQEKSRTTESQLHSRMVEAKIAQAVGAVGAIRKGAMPDILARASSVWKLDDELNLVAMNDDKLIFGTDGKTNLTPEEYAGQLLQEAPFFFEGSGGGGSGGNDNENKGAGGSINASDKVAFGSNLDKIAKGEVSAVL